MAQGCLGVWQAYKWGLPCFGLFWCTVWWYSDSGGRGIGFAACHSVPVHGSVGFLSLVGCNAAGGGVSVLGD